MRNKPSVLKISRASTQGFSLVELAIVLGVLSVVLGAIYAGMASVWEYYRIEKATEEIASTVANVRAVYSSQAGMANTGSSAITYQLIAQGNIEPDMIRTSSCANGGAQGNLCADGPWGMYYPAGVVETFGTFQVCDWNLSRSPAPVRCPANGAGKPFQTFAIQLEGLPASSCMQLVNRVTSSSGPVGLLEVNINGTNLGPTSLVAPVAISPVSLASAATYCTKAPGANRVFFVYRLTSPSS